jgi:MATE family multidrug resistance protein
MGQEPEVSAMAKPYFLQLSISFIPVMAFQAFKQFAEGLSNTFLAMIASWVANLLNIGLNYLFIFGIGPFKEMGIIGAGYATVISRFVLVFLMIYLLARHRDFSHFFKPFQWFALSKHYYTRLMNIGFPIGIQLTLELSSFALAAVMVGVLGKEQLAAHQVAISLGSISYILASGLGAAATVRIGNLVRINDKKQLKEAIKSALVMVFLFEGLCALFFLLFRHQLPYLYVDPQESQIISLAAVLLGFAALFQLSDGAQVILLGILRGMNDVRIPTIMTVIAYWGIALPVGYVLGFTLKLGAQGVWIGLVFGLSASAILQFLRVRYVLKKQ